MPAPPTEPHRPDPFRPAWWLRNPHAQTLWASLCRRAPRPALLRQRLELPDGDFVDLDWTPPAREEQPLAVLLHGLEGSARSAYMRALSQHLGELGMQALILHFRGCSGAPNRLLRSYHSGETADLELLVRWLRRHWPSRPLAVVGYSLGGNVLLKWLGERGDRARVDAAVAVSVPMDLAACAERMQHGFSRVYRDRLLASLRRKVLRKFARRHGPLDLVRVRRARGFREFDDAVTAPLHGFRSAEDYYRRSSSRAWLAGIRRPTLILHARDDPFMTPAVLPGDGDGLPPELCVEISSHGGHVGFVAGRGPLGLVPDYWLERRIGSFLSARLSGR